MGELYTLATQEVEKNPDEYKAQIERLQKQLEDGDPVLQNIWKETRILCLSALQTTLAELGSENFDKRYFESEVEQSGIQIVKQMLEDKKAEISQGAVAVNLEERNLGRFLLLKSTGASLYSTKDIALAYQKKEDYPNYTTSLYVVGSEQEHHFQQLFKTLELIGFDHNKLYHLSYGLLDLKEGKMSSRAGNVILYEDFRDQLLKQAEEMMQERVIEDEVKKQTARAVAFGAMKFRILLQDSEKKIIFDQEQALSFEGETGPYLQYTYARIASILRKAPMVTVRTEDETIPIQTVQ
jgi:arginyl-tRNA synthetase